MLIDFKSKLSNAADKTPLGNIYLGLFSLVPVDEMKDQLEYLYTLWGGTDKFHGESSKNNWFAIWHKSIRQCGFFDNCYQEQHTKLLTKEELTEFKYLSGIVKETGFSKEEGAEEGRMFNPTYLRYLSLWGIKRGEDRDNPINGVLNGILWNTIAMDDKDTLYNIFSSLFEEKALLSPPNGVSL